MSTQPSQVPGVLGVIPARWGSTRFPGKPLHHIAGKPLIQHVWDRCHECRELSVVTVATDDERIAAAVEAFGGHVTMTSPDHPSGTDRAAEVARAFPEMSHIINIQGDEPLIDPGLIDSLASALLADPALPMITAANPLAADDPLVNDPNVVKVTLTRDGHALYFSRSVIPHDRDGRGGVKYLRHQGIYGYRRKVLLGFVKWKPTPLEQAEKLEQLRALEHGIAIGVIVVCRESVGVDVPGDVAKAERALRK